MYVPSDCTGSVGKTIKTKGGVSQASLAKCHIFYVIIDITNLGAPLLGLAKSIYYAEFKYSGCSFEFSLTSFFGLNHKQRLTLHPLRTSVYMKMDRRKNSLISVDAINFTMAK